MKYIVSLIKSLAVAPFLLLLLLLCFGFGGWLLSHAGDILASGEITYARTGHLEVSASPAKHAFSYYFQVTFFLAFSGALLLIGASICLYGLAKLLRVVHGQDSRIASILYAKAAPIFWVGFVLFIVWFMLRAFRYWLVA